MYKLRADALIGHDSFIAYGETKEEVIAKMFQHLETAHPEYIGQATMQRLAELDTQMQLHILEE
jgi:predicted small metal-binding protein